MYGLSSCLLAPRDFEIPTLGLCSEWNVDAHQCRLCSVVLLFFGFRLRQLGTPLRGFFRFVPGFVDVHQLIQRVNGVSVLGAEIRSR